ncbi:MAG: hypothetical protein R3B59_07070 [Dehalococcoidia bacterium]
MYFALATVADARINAADRAISIDDITRTADCRLTSVTYGDAARTLVLEERESPCPDGTVVHAERTSLGDAQLSGRPYVPLTNDRGADDQALDSMKLSLLKPMPSVAGASSPQAALACSGYFAKKLEYNAEGGRVRTIINYQNDVGDCGDTMWITSQFTVLVVPLSPGNDLYWDEGRYGPWISNPAWDMGCKQLSTSTWRTTSTPGWHVQDDGVYTDESINDTSFGCDWWGEEYTGQVQLTN